jgi:DNA transformation protein
VAVSDEYLVFVKDQLSYLERISIRRMFGGAGIYCDGQFFAIVAEDVLYFKVDDSNCRDYEAEGMKPFTFTVDNKTSVMGFYEVPIDVLENKEKVKLWAMKAVGVAQSAKKEAGRKKKSKK